MRHEGGSFVCVVCGASVALPRGGVPLLRRVLLGQSWLTTWIDTTLFEHLNRCSGTMKILNLGSGVGLFDGYLSPHLRMIKMDLRTAPDIDLVADGHALPFATDSLDAVFSNAVFHWIVDHERLFRVVLRALRPGGRLLAQCGGRPNLHLLRSRKTPRPRVPPSVANRPI